MPDEPENNIILIAGPTASGKSRVALRLAELLDGEIINADAIQVYRDLEILSARPTSEDLALAPHHLYGVLDGSEACSAGRWAAMADKAIAAAKARGRCAIIVGGTGLYFRALTDGLSEIPAAPTESREAAQRRHAELGAEKFREEVIRFDPAMARLAIGDRQRLIRAWEVHHATGEALSSFQAAPRQPVAPRVRARVVLSPDREALYQQCEARFNAMLEAGGLDEAARLAARGLSDALPVMKALGVRELLEHLNGALTFDEAVALAKRNTRRFAKRQMTWFRGQTPDWPRAETPDDAFNWMRSQ